MINFLGEYSIFLAKIVTLVVALLIIVGFIAAAGKERHKEKLKIKKLNDEYKEMREALQRKVLPKKEFKQFVKAEKRGSKQKSRQEQQQKKRIFVLNFKGDLKAAMVENLREEITTVLNVATLKDEIVVRIESPGGMIHAYGLAASQLRRIKERNIPLLAFIDKVAASGGYLMASVADRILAAPFAVVGSIGVVAQLPNFNRLLKKHNVEYEQVTAGEYKRTISLFGENTAKGRKKAQTEVEEAHELFKQFVVTNRPGLDIKKVATGEPWYGAQAIKLGLVDQLMTSDDYLLAASETADLYEITYVVPKKKLGKLAASVRSVLETLGFYIN